MPTLSRCAPSAGAGPPASRAGRAGRSGRPPARGVRAALGLDPAPVLALALAALSACAPPPAGFLIPAGEASAAPCGGDCAAAGFEFSAPGEAAAVEIDHERRPAVVTGPDGWSWRGRIPAGARLALGVQALPASWRPEAPVEARRLTVQVEVSGGGRREVVEVERALGEATARWLDLQVDLARWAGEEVTLTAHAALAGGAGAAAGEARIAWGPIALAAPGDEAAAAAGPPNVLFLVIDTLRADHTTPYGYARDTTPEIERLLAAPGAVVETAYAQAPWTLPSATSYLTGRWPGDLLGGAGMASYGIPEGVVSLPEALARLGYRTAGLIANPTLHAGNGFARGFETFYTPAPVTESMLLHADELTRRAIPWLRAHQHRAGGRPFFLYLHYLDPHDPYDNPDTASGRSPFYPDYAGSVSGKYVHGVYTGNLPLPDPPSDVAHLTALYDSEIVYVDRHVGRVLAALDPRVLANTLVVVTSDHGEELYERGGFKHGQTLYQEQIHVPLVLRWDGRIPAGRRLAGAVPLLDLYPTVLAAAGAPEQTAAGLPGIDLLPALRGEAALPRRPVFAQHLATGPTRAAALLDGAKLILFDRESPFAPADPLQEHLYRLDLSRLDRVELYDLATDPGERTDLAAAEPGRVARLGTVVDRRLAGQGGGLTLLAGAGAAADANDGAARRLTGRLRFERPPEGWMPYFLAPGDRVDLDGAELTFDLAGEPLGKGITLLGDPGALVAAEVALDGRPAPPGRLVIGPGRPWAGGAVPAAAFELDGAAPASRAADGTAEPALLHLFRRGAGARVTAREDAETRERLRALGYLQ